MKKEKTNYRNEFKKRDCKILDYYNKISVLINGRTFLICEKNKLKTNYEPEIKNSFLKAKKIGLI
tara:strand:- start:24 stop:218 length:195 start_codon:yes stop_codon:yes gene_type:complete